MQRSSGSHVQIHPNLYFTSPGQPVVDLENYLQALEKKQQYVLKLIQKLDAKKSDDACSKSLASSESIGWLYRTIHHYIHSNPWPMVSIFDLELVSRAFADSGWSVALSPWKARCRLALKRSVSSSPNWRWITVMGLLPAIDWRSCLISISQSNQVYIIWNDLKSHDYIFRNIISWSHRVIEKYRKPWLFWVQPNGGFSLALGFWTDTGMVSWPSGGNHDDDDAEEWICELLRYNREALT